jgi:hypothetical protein
MKAVDAGPGHKNALGVNIDLNGFPRGARAAIKQSVDIFKTVTLNRGRPMVPGERGLVTTA